MSDYVALLLVSELSVPQLEKADVTVRVDCPLSVSVADKSVTDGLLVTLPRLIRAVDVGAVTTTSSIDTSILNPGLILRLLSVVDYAAALSSRSSRTDLPNGYRIIVGDTLTLQFRCSPSVVTINGVATVPTPSNGLVVSVVVRITGQSRLSDTFDLYGGAPVTTWTLQSWNLTLCNVPAAWRRGLSGKGVVIGVSDQPLDYTHPDFSNVDQAKTLRVSGTLRLPEVGEDHGTAVAGILGATGSKTICGIAFASTLVGVQDTPDSLVRAIGVCDIINMSWGPADRGGILASNVFYQDVLRAHRLCATLGRNGRGILLSLAAGNGYMEQVNASWDPTVNSRFIFAVGAINRTLIQSRYSERGSGLICVAPGGLDTPVGGEADDGCITCQSTTPFGSGRAMQLMTTMNGTSAAAPHLGGVLALVLERRPELSWRDCKELVSLTSKVVDPYSKWTLTGSGRWYSPFYGFGLIDAEAIVEAADTFELLGPELHVAYNHDPTSIEISGAADVMGQISVAEDFRLEEVMLKITLDGPDQEDITIDLISPSSTRVSVVVGFKISEGKGQYLMYPLKVEAFRGESSAGLWMLVMADIDVLSRTRLVSWSLELFGH
jgi:subtilisin family serine protease